MWLVHLLVFTDAGDHQEHIKVASCRMNRVEVWDIIEGSKVSRSQMWQFNSSFNLHLAFKENYSLPLTHHTYGAEITQQYCWNTGFYQPSAICHIIYQATHSAAQLESSTQIYWTSKRKNRVAPEVTIDWRGREHVSQVILVHEAAFSETHDEMKPYAFLHGSLANCWSLIQWACTLPGD